MGLDRATSSACARRSPTWASAGSRRARWRWAPDGSARRTATCRCRCPRCSSSPAAGRCSRAATGELATPTGMALLRDPGRRLRAAAADGGRRRSGSGRAGATPAGRANVVRVVRRRPPAADGTDDSRMWVLETNVDDLDPRLWPTVLAALLAAGAADAWLVPILMKKGRPAHTLCVLAPTRTGTALRDAVFALTSTLGVRETPVSPRRRWQRDWRAVALPGGEVRVKVGLRAGRIAAATAGVRGRGARSPGPAASRCGRCSTRRPPRPTPPGSAPVRRGRARHRVRTAPRSERPGGPRRSRCRC